MSWGSSSRFVGSEPHRDSGIAVHSSRAHTIYLDKEDRISGEIAALSSKLHRLKPQPPRVSLAERQAQFAAPAIRPSLIAGDRGPDKAPSRPRSRAPSAISHQGRGDAGTATAAASRHSPQQERRPASHAVVPQGVRRPPSPQRARAGASRGGSDTDGGGEQPFRPKRLRHGRGSSSGAPLVVAESARSPSPAPPGPRQRQRQQQRARRDGPLPSDDNHKRAAPSGDDYAHSSPQPQRQRELEQWQQQQEYRGQLPQRQGNQEAGEGSAEDDSDTSSEDSHAGEKGMAVAVADMTRLEVQRQLAGTHWGRRERTGPQGSHPHSPEGAEPHFSNSQRKRLLFPAPSAPGSGTEEAEGRGNVQRPLYEGPGRHSAAPRPLGTAGAARRRGSLGSSALGSGGSSGEEGDGRTTGGAGSLLSALAYETDIRGLLDSFSHPQHPFTHPWGHGDPSGGIGAWGAGAAAATGALAGTLGARQPWPHGPLFMPSQAAAIGGRMAAGAVGAPPTPAPFRSSSSSAAAPQPLLISANSVVLGSTILADFPPEPDSPPAPAPHSGGGGRGARAVKHRAPRAERDPATGARPGLGGHQPNSHAHPSGKGAVPAARLTHAGTDSSSSDSDSVIGYRKAPERGAQRPSIPAPLQPPDPSVPNLSTEAHRLLQMTLGQPLYPEGRMTLGQGRGGNSLPAPASASSTNAPPAVGSTSSVPHLQLMRPARRQGGAAPQVRVRRNILASPQSPDLPLHSMSTLVAANGTPPMQRTTQPPAATAGAAAGISTPHPLVLSPSLRERLLKASHGPPPANSASNGANSATDPSGPMPPVPAPPTSAARRQQHSATGLDEAAAAAHAIGLPAAADAQHLRRPGWDSTTALKPQRAVAVRGRGSGARGSSSQAGTPAPASGSPSRSPWGRAGSASGSPAPAAPASDHSSAQGGGAWEAGGRPQSAPHPAAATAAVSGRSTAAPSPGSLGSLTAEVRDLRATVAELARRLPAGGGVHSVAVSPPHPANALHPHRQPQQRGASPSPTHPVHPRMTLGSGSLGSGSFSPSDAAASAAASAALRAAAGVWDSGGLVPLQAQLRALRHQQEALLRAVTSAQRRHRGAVSTAAAADPGLESPSSDGTSGSEGARPSPAGSLQLRHHRHSEHSRQPPAPTTGAPVGLVWRLEEAEGGEGEEAQGADEEAEGSGLGGTQEAAFAAPAPASPGPPSSGTGNNGSARPPSLGGGGEQAGASARGGGRALLAATTSPRGPVQMTPVLLRFGGAFDLEGGGPETGAGGTQGSARGGRGAGATGRSEGAAATAALGGQSGSGVSAAGSGGGGSGSPSSSAPEPGSPDPPRRPAPGSAPQASTSGAGPAPAPSAHAPNGPTPANGPTPTRFGASVSPSGKLRVVGQLGTVLSDFTGDASQHQMSVSEGERVVIVHQLEGGWWYGHRLRGAGSLSPSALVEKARIDYSKQGYVPGSYVELTGERFEYRPAGPGRVTKGDPDLRRAAGAALGDGSRSPAARRRMGAARGASPAAPLPSPRYATGGAAGGTEPPGHRPSPRSTPAAHKAVQSGKAARGAGRQRQPAVSGPLATAASGSPGREYGVENRQAATPAAAGEEEEEGASLTPPGPLSYSLNEWYAVHGLGSAAAAASAVPHHPQPPGHGTLPPLSRTPSSSSARRPLSWELPPAAEAPLSYPMAVLSEPYESVVVSGAPGAGAVLERYEDKSGRGRDGASLSSPVGRQLRQQRQSGQAGRAPNPALVPPPNGPRMGHQNGGPGPVGSPASPPATGAPHPWAPPAAAAAAAASSPPLSIPSAADVGTSLAVSPPQQQQHQLLGGPGGTGPPRPGMDWGLGSNEADRRPGVDWGAVRAAYEQVVAGAGGSGEATLVAAATALHPHGSQSQLGSQQQEGGTPPQRGTAPLPAAGGGVGPFGRWGAYPSTAQRVPLSAAPVHRNAPEQVPGGSDGGSPFKGAGVLGQDALGRAGPWGYSRGGPAPPAHPWENEEGEEEEEEDPPPPPPGSPHRTAPAPLFSPQSQSLGSWASGAQSTQAASQSSGGGGGSPAGTVRRTTSPQHQPQQSQGLYLPRPLQQPLGVAAAGERNSGIDVSAWGDLAPRGYTRSSSGPSSSSSSSSSAIAAAVAQLPTAASLGGGLTKRRNSHITPGAVAYSAFGPRSPIFSSSFSSAGGRGSGDGLEGGWEPQTQYVPTPAEGHTAHPSPSLEHSSHPPSSSSSSGSGPTRGIAPQSQPNITGPEGQQPRRRPSPHSLRRRALELASADLAAHQQHHQLQLQQQRRKGGSSSQTLTHRDPDAAKAGGGAEGTQPRGATSKPPAVAAHPSAEAGGGRSASSGGTGEDTRPTEAHSRGRSLSGIISGMLGRWGSGRSRSVSVSLSDAPEAGTTALPPSPTAGDAAAAADDDSEESIEADAMRVQRQQRPASLERSHRTPAAAAPRVRPASPPITPTPAAATAGTAPPRQQSSVRSPAPSSARGRRTRDHGSPLAPHPHSSVPDHRSPHGAIAPAAAGNVTAVGGESSAQLLPAELGGPHAASSAAPGAVITGGDPDAGGGGLGELRARMARTFAAAMGGSGGGGSGGTPPENTGRLLVTRVTGAAAAAATGPRSATKTRQPGSSSKRPPDAQASTSLPGNTAAEGASRSGPGGSEAVASDSSAAAISSQLDGLRARMERTFAAAMGGSSGGDGSSRGVSTSTWGEAAGGATSAPALPPTTAPLPPAVEAVDGGQPVRPTPAGVPPSNSSSAPPAAQAPAAAAAVAAAAAPVPTSVAAPQASGLPATQLPGKQAAKSAGAPPPASTGTGGTGTASLLAAAAAAAKAAALGGKRGPRGLTAGTMSTVIPATSQPTAPALPSAAAAAAGAAGVRADVAPPHMRTAAATVAAASGADGTLPPHMRQQQRGQQPQHRVPPIASAFDLAATVAAAGGVPPPSQPSSARSSATSGTQMSEPQRLLLLQPPPPPQPRPGPGAAGAGPRQLHRAANRQAPLHLGPPSPIVFNAMTAGAPPVDGGTAVAGAPRPVPAAHASLAARGVAGGPGTSGQGRPRLVMG